MTDTHMISNMFSKWMSDFVTILWYYLKKPTPRRPSKPMILTVIYKLVPPDVRPAPDLLIQLHGRHSHRVVHGRFKHIVSKTDLPYFQLLFSSFIIHPVSQETVLEFIIDASFPHSNPITQSQGDGEVQSYLIWKEKQIESLWIAFMIFMTTVDNIFIVFVYQMVNMIGIILIILHVLNNLIFITK